MTESVWIRRVRFLTQTLIISASLNIGLLATFIYFAITKYHKEQYQGVQYTQLSKSPAIFAPTTTEILWDFFGKSFDQLVHELENPEHVESGFTRRDLALACLASFHHFNIEKALIGQISERRVMAFRHQDGGELVKITVFSAMSDENYKEILSFAKQEKWPLTPEGLFYEVKQCVSSIPFSLKEAFSATPLFQALYTLFNREGITSTQEEFLQMLKLGSWEYLSDFVDDPSNLVDFTKTKKLAFLTHYTQCGATFAANLLTKLDADYVLKRLDDGELSKLLVVLDEETLQTMGILKELLYSLRSDAIHQLAGKKLYQLSHEAIPEPYDHELAIRRFITEAPVTQNIVVSNPKKKHRVQPGESLWKISRLYHVEIEKIVEVNHLESDTLRVGKELEIP